MSEGAISIKKAIPIIVVTWIISLVTTLAVVSVAPNIFPIRTAHISDDAVTADKIADSAIITTKLADGTVTSAKILDGTITAADLATGAVTTITIADGAVTTAKIADGAVTNVKLAANAIPFNSTWSTGVESTASIAWEDIPGMSVSITLERTSHLVIMFSSEAKNPLATERIHVRALVDGISANPPDVSFTPIDVTEYGVYSCNFYNSTVAGFHTVQIQWAVSDMAGTGYVRYRTLTVIALPA